MDQNLAVDPNFSRSRRDARSDSAPFDDLLDAACVRALRLRGGERVLDVGSGLGTFGRAIARCAPDVRVVAVEIDARRLATARDLAQAAGEVDLVETRAGDARALPLAPEEWGTFDLAFARFVAGHARGPERVVAEMVRAIRPGGRVVLIDDDYELLRMHPQIEGFDAVWGAFCRSRQQVGLDPTIGRRLPALLHGARLEVRHSDWIFAGGCAGEERFDLVAKNVVDLLGSARSDVLASGTISARAFDASVERLRAWRDTPGAALWYGACVAEARRACGRGFTLTP